MLQSTQSKAAESSLFDPITVGGVELKHRIALAPLTRFRADINHTHQDIAVTYYEQRGSEPGTLLITEATFIAPQAGGMDYVPGIWSDDQVAAWKKIVDAVHAKGSKLCMQLWALGRAGYEKVLKKDGYEVVSASDMAFEGGATPRPLSVDEIHEYAQLYAQAAKNFIERAGGDMVELHGANGYLIDQFLQTNSNKRTDSYGGSIENRARFGLEAVNAVVEAVGASRTGIRLSPFSTFQGMKMEHDDIIETFSYFVKQLKSAHPELAYVHAVESRIAGNADVPADQRESLDFLQDIWAPRPFLVAGGFKPDTAREAAGARENTVVVFGRLFISNPDLPARIRNGQELTPYDRSLFYSTPGSQTPKGYTDWPFASEAKAKA